MKVTSESGMLIRTKPPIMANQFPVPDEDKAELLHEGRDILLLPLGNRLQAAGLARLELQKMGIDAALINPRFVKPLDEELISHWVKKTGHLITIEDNSMQGGFGSAVLELLGRKNLHGISTCCLGHPDQFIEHGPQNVLLQTNNLDSAAIVKNALKLLHFEC